MSETIDLARTIGRFLAGTPARARISAVLVLCAITGVLFFVADFRYATERSNLTPGFVAGPWFASPAGVSILRADPSVAFLEAVPGQRTSYLVLNLPKHFPHDLVRISVDVRADGLVSPSGRWHHARVTLFNFDVSGKNLGYLPHVVADLAAPSEWRRNELVVPMDPVIVRQQVVIHNSATAGTFGVRALTIDGIRERGVFTAIRYGLIAAWVLVLAWVLYPLARRPPSGAAARLGVLVCAAIALGALTPQPLLSQTAGAAARGVEDTVRDGIVQVRHWLAPPSRGTAAVAADSGPADPPAVAAPAPSRGASETAATGAVPATDARVPLRTPTATAIERHTFYVWPASFGTGPIAHFIAFVIAAFLLVLDRPSGFARAMGYLFVFALTTEALQSFYFSREAELEDLLMNAGGIATGAVLAVLCDMLRGRVRAHRVAARLTMN